MMLGAVAISLIMIGLSTLSKSGDKTRSERPRKDGRVRTVKPTKDKDERFKKRPRSEGGWQ